MYIITYLLKIIFIYTIIEIYLSYILKLLHNIIIIYIIYNILYYIRYAQQKILP